MIPAAVTRTSTDDAQRRCAAAEPRRAAASLAIRASSSSSSKPPSFICQRALTSFRADTDECIPSARHARFQDDSDIFQLVGNGEATPPDPLRWSDTTPRLSLSLLRVPDAPDDDDSAHRLRIFGLVATSSTAATASPASRRLSIAALGSGSGWLLLDKNSNGVRLRQELNSNVILLYMESRSSTWMDEQCHINQSDRTGKRRMDAALAEGIRSKGDVAFIHTF